MNLVSSKILHRQSVLAFVLVLTAILGLMAFVRNMPAAEASTVATFTVNGFADSGDANLGDAICNDGTGKCTLRAAIQEANAHSGADIINFSVTGTINLANALPDISDDVTFDGPGASLLAMQRSTVSGTPNFRVFTINSGKSVTISGITITNGRTADGANNGSSGDYGGGIRNNGTLTLTNSIVSSNQTGSGGNGNFGGQGGFGGGIYNEVGGMLTISNSIVRGNQTGNGGVATIDNGGFGGHGGGIYNAGTLVLTNSTISGNHSGNAGTGGSNGGSGGSGAGIFNFGTMILTNNTISGNQTGNGGGGRNLGGNGGFGGGIYNGAGTFNLTNSTISGNQTGSGGTACGSVGSGVGGSGGGIYGPSSPKHTIVANNSVASGGSGPDLSGAFNSLDYNLFKDISGATISGATTHNIIGKDPLLGPLQNNGGLTYTQALLPGSPAIDNGDPAFTPPPDFDQRGPGFPRVFNSRIDIGAFEIQSLMPTPTPSPTPSPIPTNLVVSKTADTNGACLTGDCSLREAITAANVNSDANAITFNISSSDPGCTAGLCMINLTGALPNLAYDVTISGPGADMLTVRRDTGGNYRIFTTNSGTTVTMSGFTITNGRTPDGVNGTCGFGGGPGVEGGGIRNSGTLTLTNMKVIGNLTGNGGNTDNPSGVGGQGGFGGGIFNTGTLTVTSSSISGNQTGSGGTGFGSGNGGNGGGIVNSGTLTLTSSTVSGNQTGSGINGFSGYGGNGGGIVNAFRLTVTNSTISSNRTGTGGNANGLGAPGGNGGDGAGILNGVFGILTLINSTLTGNETGNGGVGGFGGSGGGIFNKDTTGIGNAIVANNTTASGGVGSDLWGTFYSYDYNLIRNTSYADFSGTTTHNIVGQDPLLGSLMSNGGPTFTHALLVGSPAIDAGDNSVTGPPLNFSTDQRGRPRQANGTVDIGAYERQQTESRNAPVGNNAAVFFGDLTVNFNSVSVAGTTSLKLIDPNAQGMPPIGYSITGPAFDLTTTATVTGPIAVCFYLPSITDQTAFSRLRVLHNENGALVDRTVSIDSANKTICASISSLSPLVIATTVVPQIQFNAATYTANEGDGSATLTVSRLGDTSSASATVDYATSDGTAKQRTDYILAAGKLTFMPGEVNKDITILVVDNRYVDGNRTVNVTLSNPGGVPVGTPPSAVLTILDNDSAPPTTNPLDDTDARFFVRQHYYDFLSRLPDQGGFDYWSSQITQCGTDQDCIRARRIGVSNAFFYEQEFQSTGAYVYRVYKTAFGTLAGVPNRANLTYAQFMPDRSQVIGGPQLDQSKIDFANSFVQRSAFIARYPNTMMAPQYVDALIVNTGNSLTQSERDALVTGLQSSGETRGTVLRKIADNQAFIDREYNASFVLTEYFGYLRRDPDQGGYDFWLAQVNRFPIRNVDIQHAMACSFVTSQEYQQRFSPIFTHTNGECSR